VPQGARARGVSRQDDNFPVFEFSSTTNPIVEDLLTHTSPPPGVLHVPDGPGLGIEFNLGRLERRDSSHAFHGGVARPPRWQAAATACRALES
jgi:hypothetical protein